MCFLIRHLIWCVYRNNMIDLKILHIIIFSQTCFIGLWEIDGER